MPMPLTAAARAAATAAATSAAASAGISMDWLPNKVIANRPHPKSQKPKIAHSI